jgi:endonuclease/exonuclease/phosphatase family metal-dependent hydrolase
MRLATFNILSGRASADTAVDPHRFGEAVAALGADVLALQEVDRGQPRSGYVDLTGVAANAMGAREHRFVAAMSGTPGGAWSAASGDEPTGTPAYGVALLSRFPVSEWQVVRLPGLPIRVPHRWPGARRPSWVRDEARVAIVAEVHSPRGPLHIAATHLSFLPLSSRRQLARLLDTSGRIDVLMGDLNLPLLRATELTGMRSLATGLTFPGKDPVVQIDHLLTSDDRLVASYAAAVPLPVSDHRALVADV